MPLPSHRSLYAVALGSNRHGRHGRPADEVRAALAALGGVIRASRIIETAPLGPSTRRFANMVAIIAGDEPPPALLARAKGIERAFGRRRGQRWGARIIDIDLVLWSGGAWSSRGLTLPHPDFRERAFVLQPLAEIAPEWRDPLTGLSARHLAYRLQG